jgi:hypothetical protein
MFHLFNFMLELRAVATKIFTIKLYSNYPCTGLQPRREQLNLYSTLSFLLLRNINSKLMGRISTAACGNLIFWIIQFE